MARILTDDESFDHWWEYTLNDDDEASEPAPLDFDREEGVGYDPESESEEDDY